MSSNQSSASPTKPITKKSGWGSLFSNAVSGLESRLDNILAEEGTAAARNAQIADSRRQQTLEQQRKREEERNAKASQLFARRDDSDRSQSPRPGGDRLARKLEERRTNPRLLGTQEANTSRSQTQSPAPSQQASKPRSSLDSATDVVIPAKEGDVAESQSASGEGVDSQVNTVSDESEIKADPPTESHVTGDLPQVVESEFPDTDNDEDLVNVPKLEIHGEDREVPKTVIELQNELTRAHNDNEKLELRRQDEMRENLERIDALQEKLKYIVKEVLSSVRQIADEVPRESLERKVIEKDEKIALLLEEGQKLSKAEVTQSSLVRNLRAKVSEDARTLTDVRTRLTKSGKSEAEVRAKLSKIEGEKKDMQKKADRMVTLERENQDLKAKIKTHESSIQELTEKLDNPETQMDSAQNIAAAEALQAAQRQANSAEEDLANLRIELQLKDDRAKKDKQAHETALKQERDRHQAVSEGLRSEINTLEARLEYMRSRTEEVTSSSATDAHAKLLRQVETLQSQYSLAAENWQGIESSMQSRITNLEQDRDDATKMESEARRKARESTSHARKMREQFEDAQHKSQILEQELAERQAMLQKAQQHADGLQKDMQEAKEGFELERNLWREELKTKLDEEKAKWLHEVAERQSRYSPHAATQRKTSGLDLPSATSPSWMPTRRHMKRQSSEFYANTLSRPHSRKEITVTSPNGWESGGSTPLSGPNGLSHINTNIPPGTPSIVTADRDDITVEVDDTEARSSQSPKQTVNDMISNSTAAAGPSVQLVERMSASVRRLESERAATKEELARLSAQRDEARKEIVVLMEEVEEKRALEARLQKLEANTEELATRYQTTLEMLGEKSERVEELEADIQDMKTIYRELLDQSLK